MKNQDPLEVEARADIDLLLDVVFAGEDVVEREVSSDGEAHGDVLTDEVFYTEIETKSNGI